MEVVLLVAGERGDQLREVFMLVLRCFLCQAELGRDAWQVHGDAISPKPVAFTMRRLEEKFGLFVSISFNDSSAVRGEEGQVLL